MLDLRSCRRGAQKLLFDHSYLADINATMRIYLQSSPFQVLPCAPPALNGFGALSEEAADRLWQRKIKPKLSLPLKTHLETEDCKACQGLNLINALTNNCESGQADC